MRMNAAWFRRRAFYGAALLAAGVFCMLAGQGALQAALPNAASQVSVRFDDEAPDFSTLVLLRKQIARSAHEGRAKGTVTAWVQIGNTQVTCEETGGSVAVDGLWVDGNSAQIWDWRVLCGALPAFDTDPLCALDASTALNVMGSMDILGQKIDVDGRALIVACVFELPQGPTVLGADTGSGLVLCPASTLPDPLAIAAMDFFVMPNDDKSPAEWTSDWLGAASMPAPAYTEAHAEQRRLLLLVAQVPTLVVLLLTVLPLLFAAGSLGKASLSKGASSLRGRTTLALPGWQRLVLGLICSAGLLALAIFAATLPHITIDVPPSYIPTRWSDLSFWSDLVEREAQTYAQRTMLSALRPDMVRNQWISLSAGLSLACTPLFCLARHMLRQVGQPGEKLWRLLWPSLFACAALWMGMWSVQLLGWPPVAPSLPPLSIVLFTALPPLLRAFPPVALLKIEAVRGSPESTRRNEYETQIPT